MNIEIINKGKEIHYSYKYNFKQEAKTDGTFRNTFKNISGAFFVRPETSPEEIEKKAQELVQEKLNE